MRRNIIRWSTFGSLMFIILSFGADRAIVRFLLVGELPGSSISVSPSTGLFLYGALVLLILTSLLARVLPINELLKRSSLPSPRLPKKRFTSL